MIKEYVLKSGGLSVSFHNNPPKDTIINYQMLHKWLKSNSSEKIKAFDHWHYLINEIEFYFRLERVNRNTWNVFVLEVPDNPFFTFDNFEGLKLQEDFERELRESLKNKGF
jgi:hypothetical protein